MNPHQPLRTRFLLPLAGILFAACVTGAAEYRWTNAAAGDSNWSTAGNWEVNDSGWITATTPPGDGDIVRLDNTPGGSTAQTITLTGDVTVSHVRMYGTNFSYTINSIDDGEGGEYSLTGSGSVPIEGIASSSKDLIFQVPTILTNTGGGAATARPNSTNGGNLVFERPIQYGANSESPITGFFGSVGSSPGTLIYRADSITASQIHFLGSATAQVFVHIDSEDGFDTTRTLGSAGGAPHLNLSASHSFSFGTIRPGGSSGSFAGVLNVSIFDGDDRDVTFTAGTVGAGGTINLLAPADGSTGTLTLSVNNIDPTLGNLKAPDINLAAGTVLDLRGSQSLIPFLIRSAGIHGEGELHKATDTLSVIGDHNTYTGGTYITAGTLRLVGGDIPEDSSVESPTQAFSGRLGPGDLHVASGAAFELNNFDQTVSALRNDPISGTGGTVDLGDTAAGTLTINGSDDATFDGTITGSGDVLINGSGTQTLTGSNTFSGDVTIASGALLVNGSLGAGATVLVGADGSLGGSGAILGDIAVAGTLAPGNSPGTLSLEGDLLFDSGAAITFDIGSDGGDLIEFIGSNQQLASDGPLLWTFVANGAVDLDTAYTLMDWSAATGFDAWDFSLLDQTITNAGWEGVFSSDMNGLYVTFAAIPEPSTVALMLGAVALLLTLLRSHRRSCRG